MQLFKILFTKLANGFLVVLGVIVIVFFLFNVLPVNSARMTLGQRADTASVEAIEREFRLNLPWYERLILYINDLSPISLHNQTNPKSYTYLKTADVKFKSLFSIGKYTLVVKQPNLGRSFQNRRKVNEIIAEKLVPTAILALAAMALASVIGIILGVFAALRQYSFWDNAILFFSNLGISQPSFFAAFLIAMFFGYYLHDITGLNAQGPLIDFNDFGDEVFQWKNLILPVLALGIRPIAIITQLTRSSMLDVLSMDYIRTARAKGLSATVVHFKHALRNALNPVVTSISGWLAALFTGAYFIEDVFSYNGLGSTTINAIKSFDFPIVMGTTLFVAIVFVAMNILTDFVYAWLDPRVKAG